MVTVGGGIELIKSVWKECTRSYKTVLLIKGKVGLFRRVKYLELILKDMFYCIISSHIELRSLNNKELPAVQNSPTLPLEQDLLSGICDHPVTIKKQRWLSNFLKDFFL